MIDIEAYRQRGWISTQRHPELPLTVCKYTRQFQHVGEWDEVMIGMRGAVYDDAGMRVNAPMHKFFNLGERPTPEGNYIVQEKLDGTCIVAFRWHGGPVVHTLGAFGSPQAIAARAWIERTFGWDWLDDDTTYVFEWMDAGNLTTLRWTGEPTLKLLFASDGIAEFLISSVQWPGERVGQIDVTGTPEELATMVSDDEEGYVLVYDGAHMGQRHRLKVKGAHYLAMHRAVWGLSEKVVWEYLFDKTEMERALFLATLDEEARLWFRDVAAAMNADVAELRDEAERLYDHATTGVPDIRDRAATINRYDPVFKAYCFMRMNGKPRYENVLARHIKPKGHTPYTGIKDEAA